MSQDLHEAQFYLEKTLRADGNKGLNVPEQQNLPFS